MHFDSFMILIAVLKSVFFRSNMPTECCVPGCQVLGGHSFPWSDKKRVVLWTKAVRRGEQYWKPSKHTVVCSAHFDASDYVEGTTSGTTPIQKKLKNTAVPHIFPWQQATTPCGKSRAKRAARRRLAFEALEEESNKQRERAINVIGAEEEIQDQDNETLSDENAVSTPVEMLVVSSYSQTEPNRWFSIERFANDNEGLHFFTGLEKYDKFIFLLDFLTPAAYELTYYSGTMPSISVPNQLFLTLVKLRQHKTDFELSRLFEISEKSVANVYITWINFLAAEFSEVVWWPSRELIDYYMPSDFKYKFPSTRVILDGTECPIMKPQQPVAQQATFSNYKNRNTAKVVAGSSPGGLTTYVSPAYGGAASDRQIIERSTVFNRCDPKDSVMVDKGFNIDDLLIPQKVEVNIPSFFKKRNRMSGDVVVKDRKIASKRVHIERIIGLAKTYKILKEPLNNTESSMATNIIGLCFSLCNFRQCIVSTDA